jgi:hypothetical protein
MKAGDALIFFSAATLSIKGKLKRLQALDCRLREHAKPQETHATFDGLRRGKSLPRVTLLLLAIGENFAVEGPYAKHDILLHHTYDSIFDHSHELYAVRYAFPLELIDACAEGKQHFWIAVA